MFLDEPTLGLDPSSREVMWDYIQNLVRKEKLSVILTTHYMDEAEKLCDRVGIIDRGKIIALDTPANLKLMIGGDVIEIKVRGLPIYNDRDSRVMALENLGCVRKVEFTDKLMLLTVNDAGKNISEILKLVEVDNVTFRRATLNDVFLKVTGKRIREAQAEGGFAERQAEYGNK
jgi:ABC-2 type transport system ATP-binding protein